MRVWLLAVAFLAASAGLVGALPQVSQVFPLNGDFQDGSRWWTDRGEVAFREGYVHIGRPYCLGDEIVAGEVGAITSASIPNLGFRTLRYSYLARSLEEGDFLEARAIGASHTYVLDHLVYLAGNGTCPPEALERTVPVPVALLLSGEATFQLEFRVVQNANQVYMSLDLFHAYLEP